MTQSEAPMARKTIGVNGALETESEDEPMALAHW
jgi:hypothetical protein